jgi:hypothetical protein
MGRTYATEIDDFGLAETCWPCPDSDDGDTAWAGAMCRLAQGTPTAGDVALARSVMSAYGGLLQRPLRETRHYIAALRRVVRARSRRRSGKGEGR